MGQTQGGRRGRGVLATLVVFSVAYGVMCGSYFGIAPSEGSLLGKLQILDAQSQAVMMPLSIVIGVVHLSLAHLVMAWLRRGRATALSSLGWVAVMAGGTVGGIGVMGAVDEPAAGLLRSIGCALLVGGLGAVFLFSSERPLLSLNVKNHLFRLLDGLKGLTDLSGLFGDVLSYLRLFALGLSSAKLAETFNSLSQGAWDNAGFGVIVAIGIALLGHTLNLLLGIMGGVVHGLRLNCIEFFKWSLPEEGYSFTPFAKKAR
jgi:V/A-type H+-transporting ATPase subunit I